MAVPSFLFGGNTNETPQSIKQKRDLVRALMGASNAPRNIGEGLNALGDGIVANVLDRRANAAEAAGTGAANTLFNSILGGSGGSGVSGASGSSPPSFGVSSNDNPNVGSTIDFARGEGSGTTDAAGIQSYIRDAAAKRGIDPDIALRVARSEGGFANPTQQSNVVKNGIRETSYGPFQLRIGGGLGDAALKAGIDPRDPSQWQRGVDFALDQAAKGGWSPWYGARNQGIVGMAGIGKAPPTQVASLDPSIGMPSPSAAQELQTTSPAPANVPVPTARPQAAPAAIVPAPQQTAQAPQPVQVAQAAPQGQFGGVDPRLLQALQNPWLNEGQKASIQFLIQQQQHQAQQAAEQQTWQAREDYKRNADKNDPAYQLEQDYKKAQLAALTQKTGKSNLINAGEGNIYDPDTQTWIKAPSANGGAGGFRFGGNSVEAQALNGLIESGQITADQAQQLGAGKTVTGPNGEILFLTPQGIFKQPGQPQATQPQPQGIDLFGGDAQAPTAAQPQAETAVTSAPNANQTIQITAPKQASNEQLSASSFADRMHSAGQTLDQNEKQGLNGFDQFMTNSPFVPSIIGNTVVGHSNPDYQVYDRAKRDFINAQLRRESGAVIGKDEFDNAEKQYFPQPGDSQSVIDDKRRARQLAIDSMARSAGPNYKRPQPSGNSADIQAAKDAIAKGAPREAVIKRLRDAGIDTTGL